MKIVIFCQSLVSSWNHGNAHFLRGVAAELIARGHETVVYEPHDGWSRRHLLADAGPMAVSRFRARFPTLVSRVVDLDALPLDEALGDADVVIVHEWSAHRLVRRIGEHRRRSGRYTLLFHDTHHRSVTDTAAMSAYPLEPYDGVLAFGEVIRQRYLALGWHRRVWTWHEAADVRTFRPARAPAAMRDLVWIGNWGDGERSAELREFLIEPVRQLGLSATCYGVRYPPPALGALTVAGLRYGGWLANEDVPATYAAHRMTVHIPRRPYMDALPGIPTIRVFEALACGIPLVSLPWQDTEGLFTPGADYLVARTPAEMSRHLRALACDPALRQGLAEHGLATVSRRHTCRHRVDELLAIVEIVRGGSLDTVATV